MQATGNAELQAIVSGLLSGDDQTWSAFLFDVEVARQLVNEVGPDQAKAILAAGGQWSASGWTTAKLSRKLWQVALVVSSQAKEYAHLWLYALAFSWQLEVADLVLGDKAAEAAFTLMEKIMSDDPEFPGTEMKLDWEVESVTLKLFPP